MKEFGIAHFLEQCNANLDKYWRHSTFTAFTGICSQVSHKTTESYLLWFVLFFVPFLLLGLSLKAVK